MTPADYARLAARAYADPPTIGDANSASRMRVYDTPLGPVHVFRGTDDAASALMDADFHAVKVWGLGALHAGFWRALSVILPACLALPRPVAVAGHSLGAAMALIYAGVLAQQGKPVATYAFEPPKTCADSTLHDLLAATGAPVLSTRNGNDLVTQIPPDLNQVWPLTPIGKALLPINNIDDHKIERVVEALSAHG